MAEEVPKLRKFSKTLVHPNSVYVLVGKNTNYKLLFKEYGKYFETAKQFVSIMDSLAMDESLAINITCPYNRVEDMMFIYSQS